jgi:predicted glycoside hydrolase/deacetylase ChbG (UPF0249 family)
VRVIFHADDFGLTEAVNAGILEAHAGGLLKSTSLMVTAGAAERAAADARATPSLDVGLHVTLVEERPALAPARVPSLVRGERFFPRHTAVGLRYLLGRWQVAEAEAEIAAQWERLGALGLRASHCDGHQHLHLLPRVFPSVLASAHRHGVRFVRSWLAAPLGGGASRHVSLLVIQAVSRLAWRRVPADERSAMVRFPTIGFLEAGGTMNSVRLLALLDQLRRHAAPDVVEVMLHPGRLDADTERQYGHWKYHWERDLALLCDPALPEALARRGIEVTSFREASERLGGDPGVG